jgi:hypothetical protein
VSLALNEVAFHSNSILPPSMHHKGEENIDMICIKTIKNQRGPTLNKKSPLGFDG